MESCMFADRPIENAVQNNHPECLIILIKLGFNINTKSKIRGDTPLFQVAYNGRTNYVELLLKCGADACIKTNSGRTPLHEAAYGNFVDCAELLIKHGADVNAKDGNDITPLHLAAYSGSTDYVAILLRHGADLNIKNEDNETPSQTAERVIYQNKNTPYFITDERKKYQNCIDLLAKNGR